MNLFNMDTEFLQKMLHSTQQKTLDTLIKDIEETYGCNAVDKDAVKDYLLNPNRKQLWMQGSGSWSWTN